jgi:hypothetical protein
MIVYANMGYHGIGSPGMGPKLLFKVAAGIPALQDLQNIPERFVRLHGIAGVFLNVTELRNCNLFSLQRKAS